MSVTVPAYWMWGHGYGFFKSNFQPADGSPVRNTLDKQWMVDLSLRDGTRVQVFNGDPNVAAVSAISWAAIPTQEFDGLGPPLVENLNALTYPSSDEWIWSLINVYWKSPTLFSNNFGFTHHIAIAGGQVPDVFQPQFKEIIVVENSATEDVTAFFTAPIMFEIMGPDSTYPASNPFFTPYPSIPRIAPTLEFDFGDGEASVVLTDAGLSIYRAPNALRQAAFAWTKHATQHIKLRAVDAFGRKSPWREIRCRPVAKYTNNLAELDETEPVGDSVPSGSAIVLDGSDSYDVDGSVVTYQWTLDRPDGEFIVQSNSNPQFLFSTDEEGSYYVTFGVLDNDDLFSGYKNFSFAVAETGGQIASVDHSSRVNFVAYETKDETGKKVAVARFSGGAATEEVVAEFAGHSGPSLWAHHGDGLFYLATKSADGYRVHASENWGESWTVMGTPYSDTANLKFATIKETFGGGAIGVFVIKDGETIRAVSKYSPDNVTWPGDGAVSEITTLQKARPFSVDPKRESGSSEIEIREPGQGLAFRTENFGDTWETF